jgi:hypothetical protein
VVSQLLLSKERFPSIQYIPTNAVGAALQLLVTTALLIGVYCVWACATPDRIDRLVRNVSIILSLQLLAVVRSFDRAASLFHMTSSSGMVDYVQSFSTYGMVSTGASPRTRICSNSQGCARGCAWLRTQP